MKKIALFLVLLFLSTIVFSQKRGIIVNVGCSDKNDLSLLLGGRFMNNMYAAFEFSSNQKINKDNSLVCLGYGSGKSVILAKAGVCHRQVFDIPVTFHPNPGQIFPSEIKTEFDYGLEYLWIDSMEKISLCYGLSCTHYNGVQLKLGLSF